MMIQDILMEGNAYVNVYVVIDILYMYANCDCYKIFMDI
mgnify:CR=1 FL=1